MASNQYSVIITNFKGGYRFADVEYTITSKTTTGFTIAAYNTSGETSANMTVDYIVMPYTE